MTVALVLVLSVCAVPGAAETLEQALVSTFPGPLSEDGEGLARVFARTVPASFPVTSASSSCVYRFDPATDSFERLSVPLGPVFSERAETVGKHKLSAAVDYALAQYDTIYGDDLDALTSRDPRTSADYVAVCAGPTQCEPVLAVARLDLEAQTVTFSATYGLTQNLDVNFLLPLVRTFLRASTTFTGPDPRVPSVPGDFPFHLEATDSKASTGVGDLLIRAKYVLTRAPAFDLAGGLTLSLPTGERQNFQGTGDTLVGTALYASQTYAERVQPHLNAAFVLDADKFAGSQVRYSAGADVRVFDWLTVNNDFLGRSDVEQPDTIEQPVFVQIERTDVFQFSTGLKVAPPRALSVDSYRLRATLFFNTLLPLNSEDLRSDAIFVFGIELGL